MESTGTSARQGDIDESLIFPEQIDMTRRMQMRHRGPLDTGICYVYASLPSQTGDEPYVRMAYQGPWGIPSVSQRLRSLRWGVITKAVVDAIVQSNEYDSNVPASASDRQKAEEKTARKNQTRLKSYIYDWYDKARLDGVILKSMSVYVADRIEEYPFNKSGSLAPDGLDSFLKSNTPDGGSMVEWQEMAKSICAEFDMSWFVAPTFDRPPRSEGSSS